MKLPSNRSIILFLQTVALIAALGIPCTILADNTSSQNSKPAATQAGNKNPAANDPVRFNWVDGEPVHYTAPSQ